jgi:hypothetical protein
LIIKIFPKSFKTLEIYEKASGPKMNLKKTVGMYLEKWRNKNLRERLGILDGLNVKC